ncbi:MAG: HD domain-containing protein [Euryarchaeota archaeon]|nr:HD domain-containing protein [Euryarchaeota archaeon]
METERVFRELYDLVRAEMEDGGAHDFDHVERVLRLAVRIAEEEGADVEVVRFAALLHDLERAREDRGEVECHATASAERAERLLLERGLSREFAARVAECIRSHRFRKGLHPESIEARVLSDADKLDATGAVGIARAYLFGGKYGQRVWEEEPKDVRFYPGMRGAEYSPRTEYELKLSRLRERMFTATGRRIAEHRSRFMELFFEELEKEVRGER